MLNKLLTRAITLDEQTSIDTKLCLKLILELLKVVRTIFSRLLNFIAFTSNLSNEKSLLMFNQKLLNLL